MAIELRLLRYFTVVAEELHFGHAAAWRTGNRSPLLRALVGVLPSAAGAVQDPSPA